MISKFRIDLIFYSFIILISLIPLYFLNPGKIEIYSIKMYDINSVLLWRGEGGCSYYDFDTVKEYKDFSKYSFNPEGYTPLTINSNPILSDNKIYISFRDRIVSVDIKDMKEIWSKKVSITPKTSLTVIGDYIFLPSEKSIIGMDKENGEIVFKF
ncbi:MAG: hypothetical protein H5U37_06910, partial [Caldisericia bacterium]|nr:hypothetical protein [Caldisericia bacterium]